MLPNNENEGVVIICGACDGLRKVFRIDEDESGWKVYALECVRCLGTGYRTLPWELGPGSVRYDSRYNKPLMEKLASVREFNQESTFFKSQRTVEMVDRIDRRVRYSKPEEEFKPIPFFPPKVKKQRFNILP